MTPERENEIRIYVVEHWGSGSRVIGHLDELLAAFDDQREALDSERERNAKLERVAETAERWRRAPGVSKINAACDLVEALAALEETE